MMGEVFKNKQYDEGKAVIVKTNEQLHEEKAVFESLQQMIVNLHNENQQLKAAKAELVEALETVLLFGQMPNNIANQAYGVLKKYKEG